MVNKILWDKTGMTGGKQACFMMIGNEMLIELEEHADGLFL
jgi:hypothetical protein